MELISITEAAERKGCTRQAIFGAIKRGEVDAQRIGHVFIVSANEKFNAWRPGEGYQKAGRARAAKAKKGRKTA